MQRRFIASGFFALRTPLLSLDELTAFSARLSAPAATDGEIDEAVECDREILCERLRVAFERSELRDALYVASPSLENALAAWRPGGDDARSRKVELRLVRYLELLERQIDGAGQLQLSIFIGSRT